MASLCTKFKLVNQSQRLVAIQNYGYKQVSKTNSWCSYRKDVTPAKSVGVEFRSRARSIAVTLTYLGTNIFLNKFGESLEVS